MMVHPATEAQVDVAERELGVKLPREYRVRLMADNGGELTTGGDKWRVFPVLDSTDQKTAARTANHIVLENGTARVLPGFPQGAVAIAKNAEGDYLVLLPARLPKHLDPQVQRWISGTTKYKPVALRYDD